MCASIYSRIVFIRTTYYPVTSPLAHKPRSQRLDMTQQPLQVSVAAPRLELRLHVPTQGGLGPHQAALVMLDAHRALRVVNISESTVCEDTSVLEIRQSDDNRSGWLRLEPQFSSPGHILDR